MELTARERGLVSNLLPAKGNFDIISMLHGVRMRLALTLDEYKELGVKNGFKCKVCSRNVFSTEIVLDCACGGEMLKTGAISWDLTKDKLVDIEIPQPIYETIRALLVKMNKDEELTEEFITLYPKFVDVQ